MLYACSHNHSPDDHSHGSSAAPLDESGHKTESVTLYSENYEVFVEFDVLMVGHSSEFLIHVTRLDTNYSALSNGTVKVILNIDGNKQTVSAKPDKVEGIYKISIEPEAVGIGSLAFIIGENQEEEQLSTEHIHVYKHNETDIHHHESGLTGLTRFTKEQAWKSKFNILKIEAKSFGRVITASGEFLAMPGEKQNVIAKSFGIVLFANKNLVQGRFVNRGEELFTISGQGLAENNIMVRFNRSEIDFEISKSNFSRHKTLLTEKIISERQFLETKNKYITDSIMYYSLKESINTNGLKILAPKTGYIHDLNVSEGIYVDPGTLMATISTNKVILLRADVPQQYFNELSTITTTHFRPAYTSRVYTLEELSGKLIARGASVAENNHYLPVYFEVVNDGSILEGAFAEFFLKTNPVPGQIVIPVTSLIEDQGSYSVYIQVSGEEFQKRPVIPGANDGIYTSIVSGISLGERVVSEGPMLIKMASASAIPGHSHEH